ncbi:MAG: 3-deoxy-manno-octulosonate cytidylyltransferase [Armatimonadetes bacterium]|nr:MAG: 3-deoxy-manno-octulosonate cytidylyltransferase [Armatimonadota bacterium]
MVAIVIPARMGSTRFPGKPLADLCGKPMVQWVYERAAQSKAGDAVLVATPDREIAEAVQAFGGEAMMTSNEHETGTDRIAEVARRLDAEFYVNVQGDEPLIRPETIRACAEALTRRTAPVASVYDSLAETEADDPNIVKVVMDRNERALYFSRAGIPYPRNARLSLWKHIGIYGYTREALQSFAAWPQTPLERTEGLEQLRFLENGFAIQMARGQGTELAVDTPEQLERVKSIMEKEQ